MYDQDYFDESYNECRRFLSLDIKKYILNKNKHFKEDDLSREESSKVIPILEIIEDAIDMNDEALFYCEHTAEMYTINKVCIKDEDRFRNKALKKLKEMFADFKLLEKGQKFTCSTNFIFSDKENEKLEVKVA
jgi:hypothetical protein